MMKERKTMIFDNVKDFDPDQIFDCGQCFRWSKDGESGLWKGIVGRRVSWVRYDGEAERLEVFDPLLEEGEESSEALEKFWRNYFDLDRDYGMIKERLRPFMPEAIEAGSGIRILNQDRWETLISFIISQNNNIPRIRKCIEALARELGDRIESGLEAGLDAGSCGQACYSLPTSKVLSEATEEDLAPCKLGYRAEYLIGTARMVREDPGCLDRLASGNMSYDEAIQGLREFKGVGPKVANCIALFCMGHVDSFPLDVWMKRIMNQMYGIEERDTAAMMKYAKDNFSPYGGIAQQYLFNYVTSLSKNG